MADGLTKWPGTSGTNGYTSSVAGRTKWPASTSGNGFTSTVSGRTTFPAPASVDPPPPGSPVIWFSARNIDGSNNSTLTDGNSVQTWKNLGTLGSAADVTQPVAGQRMIYRAVAAAGKINNKPGLQGDGTQSYTSSVFAIQAQPTTVVMLRRKVAAGESVELSGTTGNRQILAGNGTAQQIGTGGSLLPNTGLTLTSNAWQVVGAVFNGASSVGFLDGTTGSAVNADVLGMDAISIFEYFGHSFLCVGFAIEALVYSGAGQPTLSQVYSWITGIYGAMPQ